MGSRADAFIDNFRRETGINSRVINDFTTMKRRFAFDAREGKKLPHPAALRTTARMKAADNPFTTGKAKAIRKTAPPVGRRPVFRVTEEARGEAERLWLAAGIRPGEAFAVVAPGSNRAEARWRAEGFAAVCDGLESRGVRPVLVGRGEDAPVTREVAAAARRRPADLTARTSLASLAGVLARASLLVANDSGTSHLAAAVRCPTVAVFGPTDPALTFPYEDGRRFLSVSAPIDHPRPCFDLSCGSDHGFGSIGPGDVLGACARALDAGREPAPSYG